MPLLWACSPEDDDKTKVIFSSFNKGSFSVRIFELKVDSTFRYYRNVHGNTTDVNGYWTMEKDTFNLYHKNTPKTLGALYHKKEYKNGIPTYGPYFQCVDTSSALFDLTYPNARGALQQYNPPRNLDFGVNRSKPEK